MAPVKDLAGQRFGRLLVQTQVTPTVGRVAWVCLCDCGVTKEVRGYSLTVGQTTSCGCRQREIAAVNLSAVRSNAKRTHGGSSGSARPHALYSTWCGMRTRCNTETNENYPDYGGRGIKICARWDDFALFVSDVGVRPPGHTLDRIDVDGNYEPGNVRWATRNQQAANKRKIRDLQRRLDAALAEIERLRSTVEYAIEGPDE